MIICHTRKTIFFGTRTAQSTAIELALSALCGPDCVITPLGAKAEVDRRTLGLRPPQNTIAPAAATQQNQPTAFHKDMSAAEARAFIPDQIWGSYQKIAVAQHPSRSAVELYETTKANDPALSFAAFVDRFRGHLGQDSRTAPYWGPYAMDRFLRAEKIDADIDDLGLEGLRDALKLVHAQTECSDATAPQLGTLLTEDPCTATILSEEYREYMAHFGYHADWSDPAFTPSPTAPLIFTLAAGRSGTMWLSNLLSQNFGIPTVHEPLGASEYGTQMPDTRTLRQFNTYGMVAPVRAFWQRKFLSMSDPHIETNHTLGKCGLVEALVQHGLDSHSKIIILRRDLADQCLSYLMRNDFSNVGMEWQWFLSQDYPNIMVNPAPLQHLGVLGKALWYCFEMDARQAYYKQMFGHRLCFIEAQLEEARHVSGAEALLSALGYEGTVRVPEKANASPAPENPRKATIRQQLNEVIAQAGFDADSVARDYIENGRVLAQPQP